MKVTAKERYGYGPSLPTRTELWAKVAWSIVAIQVLTAIGAWLWL